MAEIQILNEMHVGGSEWGQGGGGGVHLSVVG